MAAVEGGFALAAGGGGDFGAGFLGWSAGLAARLRKKTASAFIVAFQWVDPVKCLLTQHFPTFFRLEFRSFGF